MRCRILQAVSVMFLMLLLTGCAGNMPENAYPTATPVGTEHGQVLPGATQSPTPGVTLTPTPSLTPTLTPTPTPTPIPGYKQTAHKSEYLSGQYIQNNSGFTYVNTIIPLGDKCVLIYEETLEQESGSCGMRIYISLYDYNSNEITKVRVLESDYRESYYYGKLSTGKHFMIFDYERNIYQICDETLECVSEIRSDAFQYQLGVVAENLQEVYLARNHAVCRINKDGKTEILYENPVWEDATVVKLCCDDRYAELHYFTSDMEEIFCHTAFLDLQTGEIAGELDGTCEIELSPDGEYCILKQISSRNRLQVYRTKDRSLVCDVALETWQEVYNYCADWKNGYIITTINCEKQNYQSICEVRAYDLYTGEYLKSSVTDCDEDYILLRTGMLDDSAFYAYYLLQDGNCRFSLWDCKEVEKQDLSMYFPRYWEKKQELPEAINARRDELEEKYGIQIMMGDEFEYDDYSYDCGMVQDPEIINRALDTLEQVCDLYPEGFFLQLQSGRFKKFSIYLTGMLRGKDEFALDYAAGFACERGYERAIVVDITEFDLYNHLIHEIGHQIQNEIHQREFLITNPNAFDSGFQEFNPEGFVYRYSYDDYESGGEFDRYVTWFGKEEEACFIDFYALTFQTEDVSRCLEYMMGDGGAIYMRRYPRIRQKMQYLSDCMRLYFDTTGWPEKTSWEIALEENAPETEKE